MPPKKKLSENAPQEAAAATAASNIIDFIDCDDDQGEATPVAVSKKAPAKKAATTATPSKAATSATPPPQPKLAPDADSDEAEKLIRTMRLDDSAPAVEEPVSGGAQKLHCVGFIHCVGLRAEEIPIKVFATNNVGNDRKTWEEGQPQNLKTHAAIYCHGGDADTIVSAWHKLNSTKSIEKSRGWYKVSKKAVDTFIEKLTQNAKYESVSEAKAKFVENKKK